MVGLAKVPGLLTLEDGASGAGVQFLKPRAPSQNPEASLQSAEFAL